MQPDKPDMPQVQIAFGRGLICAGGTQETLWIRWTDENVQYVGQQGTLPSTSVVPDASG